ncbi:hypothetical protein [uncultured Pseudoflavonifractor sp.]|uniref:hypothetical protein n=1 Tax=uncultured Pseudoflavonifractor sp. TaxID=1221379 RepID=UPI0025FFB503|nr:hypothetical protein [uncultured Pseudoflavonifractor sp.]
MTRTENARWRERTARKARTWVRDPWTVLETLDDVINTPKETCAAKLDRIRFVLEAYNDARKEASNNAQKI